MVCLESSSSTNFSPKNDEINKNAKNYGGQGGLFPSRWGRGNGSSRLQTRFGGGSRQLDGEDAPVFGALSQGVRHQIVIKYRSSPDTKREQMANHFSPVSPPTHADLMRRNASTLLVVVRSTQQPGVLGGGVVKFTCRNLFPIVIASSTDC